jgi:ribonuclease E
MPKQIIIAEQHRIAAVFSEDQIQELVVATGNHQVGDIYLGMVENVLPGIDAAFVNIGDVERNGFIHVSDLGPLRLKRSAGAITELLTPQQKVLVQVMKEPTGTKGPRLTGNITMPGRYLVLMPFGRGVNLSRRIKNETERNRLRALAILLKPAGMGLLVRTEAEGRDEEAIIEDLEALLRQWEAVQQEAQSVRAPALLNRDDDFIQRVLRDMYSADVNRIVVDSHTGTRRVKQQLLSWSGGKTPPGVLIDHHRDRIPVLEYFRVNAAIREALKPRVDLPSGGYIIIEPTEALTVVDVNSGSFTRSATARETVLWTNCEAATEIARQLRLRNLAGVIIVDFIDMDARRDQLQVLEHFNKALKSDKARPQIAQLSELGLVELTRKRQGQNIYELFGRTCPTCGGLGHLVELPGEGEQKLNTYSASLAGIKEASSQRERESTTVPAYGKSEGLRLGTGGGEVSDRPAAREYRAIESRSRSVSERESLRVPPGESRGITSGELRSKSSIDALGLSTVESLSVPSSYGATSETISDLDLSPSSDLDDLDLSYHPNYQERGQVNNPRRRRRRRIGFGEGFADEAGDKRDAGMFAPTESDWDAESEVAPSTSSFSPTPSKINRGETSERQRPVKPEATPPEVITVEMTPEEQEVYALMGVSPLVRLNRQVKNPKSAIVAVRSPGQAEASPLDTGLTTNADDESDDESDDAKEISAPPTPQPKHWQLSLDFPTSRETREEDEEQMADEEPMEMTSTPAELEGEGLSRRRRRRRSSAVEADGNE